MVYIMNKPMALSWGCAILPNLSTKQIMDLYDLLSTFMVAEITHVDVTNWAKSAEYTWAFPFLVKGDIESFDWDGYEKFNLIAEEILMEVHNLTVNHLG